MAGKVAQIDDALNKDTLGCNIAKYQYEWHMLRAPWVAEVDEVRRYIFATDTTKTSNSKLPWKNKTTVPKLCQIRDNLYSNYYFNVFPKKKWLRWDADNRESNTLDKRKAITSYMNYVISQRGFKEEMSKCILDYIDTGNAFSMPTWIDQRVEVSRDSLLNSTGLIQVGYVGPSIQRISPLDITFNPIASTFEDSPKIIRSVVTMGEVKDLLESLSTDDTRKEYEALFDYMKTIRSYAQNFGGELASKDSYLEVDGFTSYQLYLKSNYCEILTFYGDIYDEENDVFLKNRIITVVDRHKVIGNRPNPSYFGKPQIYHVGWRIRQDNLWAMGPLANIVGLQYRIDHIENLKADVFDLITFPPLKIKGYVTDFEWGPMARIYIGDRDSDVEMMAPPFQVLQANIEIQNLISMMEELAGSPKEAMGFRTPGEKTKYEVQRMENASGRIFQNKANQFEEFFVEPSLNGMMEIGRRKVTSDILVKYFDEDENVSIFLDLTPDDLTGSGRIRPYASRHFAEQAELVQNVTNLFSSPLGQVVAPHFSTIKLAQLFEDLFDLTDYQMVKPYIALAEQADAQRLAQALQQQVLMEAMTPSGITPGDTALPVMQPQGAPGQPQAGPQQAPPTNPFLVGGQ